MATRRNVLVHFHIFKNGGTTFDYALKREFGKGFAEYDGNQASSVHLPEEIAAYLVKRPKVRALSSHHLRFPLPEVEKSSLFGVVFLRHPLDRMHSIYKYERKQKSESPGSKHAKKYSFPDYVQWRLDRGRVNLLCNYHASVLTCNPREARRVPDAELARTRLKEVAVCGTVDQLEASLALAEQQLAPHFSGINLATTPQNVTVGRKPTLQERMNEAEKACGSELFADVAARNELDLDLYALAGRLLQERLHGLADGERCLEAYRKRCGQLA
ncbi:MAG: sulfotransferase family 2 domain-containing protein [Planctomycetota bacterium]|nr:sulfotransferase family 2 domain-containing protein [Planctomycetota bacterium]